MVTKRRSAVDGVFATTTDLINYKGTWNTDDIVVTDGFLSVGDGGGAKWKLTGNTIAASQTPALTGKATLSDANGNEFALDSNVINPVALGAKGDGVTDDSTVISLCYSIVRQKILDLTDIGASVVIDGQGKEYSIGTSVNATQIVGWNYVTQNMYLIGRCTGQAVLDFVGSRGGSMSNVVIYGDKDNMPSRGMQFARSSIAGFAFCDNWSFHNVSTIGWYSEWGFYAYGQESTHYDHSRFWNYNPQGRAACFTGSNLNAPISSLYSAPISGSTSYINNKYTAMDMRYVPIGSTSLITNISNSNPAVVTVSVLNNVSEGDLITIDFTTGISGINNGVFTAVNVSGNTFKLDGVDTTAAGTYTGGGNVVRSASSSAVYLSRCEQHTFDSCYIVNYGKPQLQIDFVDNEAIEQLRTDWLFEGHGADSHIEITGVALGRNFYGCRFHTYKTLCFNSVIKSDAVAGVTSYRFDDLDVSITTHSKATVPLWDDPAKYVAYNAKVAYPSVNGVAPTTMLAFNGTIGTIANGVTEQYGVISTDKRSGDYTPSITAQTGALGSVSILNANYRYLNGVGYINLRVTITDIGSGTGYIGITLPTGVVADGLSVLGGRENGVTGRGLQVLASASQLQARFEDGTTGFSSGAQLIISGTFSIN